MTFFYFKKEVLINERIPSPSFHQLEDSIRSSKAYSLSETKHKTKQPLQFGFTLKIIFFYFFLSESSNDYSLREAIVHSHFHTLAFPSYRFAVSFFAIFIDPFK